MEYFITSIDYVMDGGREVHVHLSNGATVKICPCYESWEQYGCTLDEKRVTVGIADIVNDWLHGDDEKPDSDVMNEIHAIATEWLKENQRDVFSTIDDYDLKSELAMGKMERDRCPLQMAFGELYNEMHDRLVEWCDEYDLDPDEIDLDNVIF